MLVDSHCHLNMLQFEKDLEQVISNAKNHNVKYLQTICTKIEDYAVIKELTEKYKNLFCSFGIHPNEVDNSNTILSTENIIKNSQYTKTIGIGETGLDYYHKDSKRENQKTSFVRHIEASRITKLPIIIHTRNADQDTQDILISEMKNGNFPGLIHCFTASKELARKVLDLGMYISISGIVTFKNATNLQEIVKWLPINRILIETDSPYLAPTPYRGKRNEPAFVKEVAEYIACLKNMNYEKIAETTTNNFFQLFRKAKK